MEVIHLPIKAFGIVIFNHILSLISNPESGLAMAATMVDISLLIVRCNSSNGPRYAHAK